MKSITRHIPNFITCLNLVSGCIGITLVFRIDRPEAAALMVFIAAFFDLLDGLFARILKAESKIGKDLDSLADIVSFGVLPGLLLYKSISLSSYLPYPYEFLSYLGLAVPVFAALRLARFNNDSEQQAHFKGIPTPAVGLSIAAITFVIRACQTSLNPLIPNKLVYPKDEMIKNLFFIGDVDYGHCNPIAEIYSTPPFLIGTAILLSLLMVSNIPFFSFKIKDFSFNKYIYHFMFLITSATVGAIFGFAAAPIILLLYIIFSFIHFRSNNHEIQSGN